MAGGDGELEVAFYERAAPRLPAGLAPRCLAAAFDAESGNSHVLLIDLSQSHTAVRTRSQLLHGAGVPARRVIDALMAALARFHSTFWEDPAIGETPFGIRPWFSDAAAFANHVRRREHEWALATSVAVDELGGVIGAGYERDLARLPDLWTELLESRITARRHLTLAHGDCYLSNWLQTTDGLDVSLIDFDSVSACPPTFDLVFLMATFWTRAQRVAHEGDALAAYHSALASTGVAYSWSDLIADYRTMLLLMRFDVIFDIANGSPATYWRPKLACLTAACDDWRDGPPAWVAG
jgi:aminoglycoside phosphotransferase (APT) family kinase protein